MVFAPMSEIPYFGRNPIYIVTLRKYYFTCQHVAHINFDASYFRSPPNSNGSRIQLWHAPCLSFSHWAVWLSCPRNWRSNNCRHVSSTEAILWPCNLGNWCRVWTRARTTSWRLRGWSEGLELGNLGVNVAQWVLLGVSLLLAAWDEQHEYSVKENKEGEKDHGKQESNLRTGTNGSRDDWKGCEFSSLIHVRVFVILTP